MNKFLKIIIAILGATNAVFSMFTPVAIALIVITVLGIDGWRASALIVAAIFSAVYRAIRIGIMK